MNRHHIKFHIFIILQIISLHCFAQNIGSLYDNLDYYWDLNTDSIEKGLPKDPKMPMYSLARNYSLAFMIKEDSAYAFYVNQVIRLKKGYLLELFTIVRYPLITDAYVVTNSRRYFGKPIRAGKCYSMKLKYYTEEPSLPSEKVNGVKDVLLGDRIISVEESGCFTYLFTSLYLNGVRSKRKTDKSIQEYDRNKAAIDTFLKDYLAFVSYDPSNKGLAEMTDSVSATRVLSDYSAGWNKKDVNSNAYPSKEVEKYQWPQLFINMRCFSDMFLYMLNKEYALPVDSTVVVADTISLLSSKLLYCDNKNYTIGVKWEIPGQNHYAAILSLRKKKDSYIVSGFNRF